MPIPSARQLRAGRVLLGLSQAQLAKHAKVGMVSIYKLEKGANTEIATLEAVVYALEKRGLEFTSATSDHGEGVRLKKGGAVSAPRARRKRSS